MKIPVLKNAGEHQLTIDLDYTGLIVESSEGDNSSSYFFTVATTDFKVLFPTQNSISSVDKIIFLNSTTAGPASVVAMELDTNAAFTTPQSFSKTLQQFATSFPLPSLKKKKRYFWRAKVQGSPHDWTVGSSDFGKYRQHHRLDRSIPSRGNRISTREHPSHWTAALALWIQERSSKLHQPDSMMGTSVQ